VTVASLDARPLSPALGAEVVGLDAREPLDADVAIELQDLYDEHHLLLFRDQHLDAQQQERFVSTFGPPIDDMADGVRTGYISNVMEDRAGSGPLPFHADYSFTPLPVQGIVLYAVELPPQGTSTYYANGALAAATLPDDLRREVEDLTATHTLGLFAPGTEGLRSRDHELLPEAIRHRHPVLRTHPRTGDTVLFVTDLHLEHIDGVDADTNDRLIDALLEHLYQPANVYEHRWTVDDLVVWDNETLQHMRTDITNERPRSFLRNTLHVARWSELVPLP
jgi:alpha-ketoglutarate-dependent taurine dioxygenase